MNLRQLIEIELEYIDPGSNIREEVSGSSVADLAQSVESRGVQEPVTVRPNGDRFVLLRGFRRFAAAKLAGVPTIQAIVDESEATATQIRVAQLTENLHREDLTDVELAKAIDQLIRETNWTAAQVAEELGLKTPHVSNLRSLLTLPPTVQEAVKANQLASSIAFEIARAKGAELQSRLAGEAIDAGLTRDGVAAKVKATKRRREGTSSTGPARATAALGAGRSITVVGNDLTLERFISWLEELLTRARRARPKGLELATFLKVLRDQAKSERSDATPC